MRATATKKRVNDDLLVSEKNCLLLIVTRLLNRFPHHISSCLQHPKGKDPNCDLNWRLSFNFKIFDGQIRRHRDYHICTLHTGSP